MNKFWHFWFSLLQAELISKYCLFLILVVLSSKAISKQQGGVTLNAVLAYWILHKVFSFKYTGNLVYQCFLIGPVYLFNFWSLDNSKMVMKPFCIFITVAVLQTSLLRCWCWILKFTWKIFFLISFYFNVFFQTLAETCPNLFKFCMFFFMLFQLRTQRLS